MSLKDRMKNPAKQKDSKRRNLLAVAAFQRKAGAHQDRRERLRKRAERNDRRFDESFSRWST
jgi:hypothetical protein